MKSFPSAFTLLSLSAFSLLAEPLPISFEDPFVFASPQGESLGLEVAELSGDTEPELIRLTESRLEIYPGIDFSSAFANAPQVFLLPESNSQARVEVADIDGNGLLDVVVFQGLDDITDFVSILPNYENGFGELISFQPYSGGHTTQARLLDTNYDGLLDLVYLGLESENGRVYQVFQTEPFVFGAPVPLANQYPRLLSQIEVGDFTGDRRGDILVTAPTAEGDNTEVLIYVSQPTGITSIPGASVFSASQNDVLGLDILQDGYRDLRFRDGEWLNVRRGLLGGADAVMMNISDPPLLPFVRNLTRLVADFDQDGQLDFLNYNQADEEFRLLRGRDEVGYTESSLAFSPLDDVSAFTVGDTNEDSLPDLIYQNGNFLYLAIQNPPTTRRVAFSWLEREDLGSGSAVTRVELLDQDKDGDLDLISSGGSLLFFNEQDSNGDLVFVSSQVFDGPIRDYFNGDFDGDGAADHVAAMTIAPGVSSLQIDLGAPGGPLIDVSAGTEGNFEEIAAADFNKDGALDIAGIETDKSTVRLYLGAGDGTFGTNQPMPSLNLPGETLREMLAADLDDDGASDLVIMTDERLLWLRNLGNGSFDSTLRVITDGRTDLQVVNFLPLGRAKKPSLAFGGEDDQPYNLAFNISVTGAEVTPLDGGPSGLQFVCDFDGDGVMELIQRNFQAEGDLFLQGEGGSLTRVTGAPDFGASLIAPGDYDGDGWADFVVIGPGGTELIRNTTPRNERFFTTQSQQGFVATAPDTILLEDLDEDGGMDVVSCRKDSGEVLLSRGQGSAGLESATVLYTAISAGNCGLRSADLDCDGDPDLVLLREQGPELILLENFRDDGSEFREFDSVKVPEASAFALGDFDEDGDPDVVVVSLQDDEVLLFPTDGAGGLGSSILLTDGISNIRQLEAADLDEDGDLDLAVRTPDSVYCLFNGGSSWTDLELPQFPSLVYSDLVVTDVDKDGHPDILALEDREDPQVRIWELVDGVPPVQPVRLTELNEGNTGTRLFAKDIDSDGDIDLLVQLKDGKSQVCFQNAAGDFPNASWEVASNAPGVEGVCDLEDLTGNGLLDFVWVTSSGGFWTTDLEEASGLSVFTQTREVSIGVNAEEEIFSLIGLPAGGAASVNLKWKSLIMRFTQENGGPISPGHLAELIENINIYRDSTIGNGVLDIGTDFQRESIPVAQLVFEADGTWRLPLAGLSETFRSSSTDTYFITVETASDADSAVIGKVNFEVLGVQALQDGALQPVNADFFSAATRTGFVEVLPTGHYAAWREREFGHQFRHGPYADEGDFDGDTVENLVEYATATQVLVPDSPYLGEVGALGVAGFGGLSYQYDPAADAALEVVWSPDLQSFFGSGEGPAGDVRTISVTSDQAAGDVRNQQVAVPLAPTGKVFLRLEATR